MRFLGFLTRRIVGIAAVMVGVSIITCAISHVVPADPVAAALGDHATDQQIEAFRAEYHLDRPLPEQYLTYITGLVHGDLGRSIRTRRPVSDDLFDSFPATIELSLAALVVAIVVGIPAGVWSAIFRARLPDHLVRLLSLRCGADRDDLQLARARPLCDRGRHRTRFPCRARRHPAGGDRVSAREPRGRHRVLLARSADAAWLTRRRSRPAV